MHTGPARQFAPCWASEAGEERGNAGLGNSPWGIPRRRGREVAFVEWQFRAPGLGVRDFLRECSWLQLRRALGQGRTQTCPSSAMERNSQQGELQLQRWCSACGACRRMQCIFSVQCVGGREIGWGICVVGTVLGALRPHRVLRQYMSSGTALASHMQSLPPTWHHRGGKGALVWFPEPEISMPFSKAESKPQ